MASCYNLLLTERGDFIPSKHLACSVLTIVLPLPAFCTNISYPYNQLCSGVSKLAPTWKIFRQK